MQDKSGKKVITIPLFAVVLFIAFIILFLLKVNSIGFNENKQEMVSNEKANEVTVLKEWLSQNPITVQYQLAENVIKTVDLSILDQNENKVSSISSFNDTTHITASSETIPPIFEGYLATKEVE